MAVSLEKPAPTPSFAELTAKKEYIAISGERRNTTRLQPVLVEVQRAEPHRFLAPGQPTIAQAMGEAAAEAPFLRSKMCALHETCATCPNFRAQRGTCS